MMLYHGSTQVIELPDVTRSRPNLDFGQGFYLTSYRKQAVEWAMRKAFLEGGKGYVNRYDVVGDLDDCRVLRFPETDKAWVDFVCSCRRGEDAWREYDLIVGGVADDRVYYAVDMYYQGIWSIERTLEALRFYKVNDQWCFASQEVLDRKVRFVGYWEV